jgi:hypothetical protein
VNKSLAKGALLEAGINGTKVDPFVKTHTK